MKPFLIDFLACYLKAGKISAPMINLFISRNSLHCALGLLILGLAMIIFRAAALDLRQIVKIR